MWLEYKKKYLALALAIVWKLDTLLLIHVMNIVKALSFGFAPNHYWSYGIWLVASPSLFPDYLEVTIPWQYLLLMTSN